ncbi:MAG TPA: penicillin-binding protein 2 [Candidatus Babeliales bacterium]|nr:penicillin-binding protein 2 [Candidatus Babeliales bacterium]
MMNNSYKVRSGIIFLCFCLLYTIIILKLYLLQIQRNAFFTELGEKQYNVSFTTNPPRAPIYDRKGKFLAMNKDSLAAFILPKKLTSPETLKPFLKKHFPHALERLAANSDAHFMYIGRRLTDEQIRLIQESNIADIQLLNEPHRFYPVPAAGQIIGLTDIDNKGIIGLELLFHPSLAGKPTTYSLERDARSGHFYFKRKTTVEGKDGEALYLTIDGDLQFLAHEELKKTIDHFAAKEGSVLVMNPKNGEILAMTSWPDFDPNDTKQIDMAHTKNRVITEEYELGSVIKAFSALAALEEGVVTIDEPIDCENVKTTYVDGRKINTVTSSITGLVPFSQVIEKSNNIGIAKVVRRLGPSLYTHYKKLGFGKKTNIQFPGERAGFVNPPEQWSKQSLFSLSYGYEITATLLQLARAFCIIANDGRYIEPTLNLKQPQTMSEKPLFSAQAITTIKQILENTVLQGSAKKARIQGYRVMSKTGTANILINGQYSPDDNQYTGAAIIEKGNYQRVIITFIRQAAQKNLYASTVTIPLLERVAEKMLIHEKIL